MSSSNIQVAVGVDIWHQSRLPLPVRDIVLNNTYRIDPKVLDFECLGESDCVFESGWKFGPRNTAFPLIIVCPNGLDHWCGTPAVTQCNIGTLITTRLEQKHSAKIIMPYIEEASWKPLMHRRHAAIRRVALLKTTFDKSHRSLYI
jgi:hypothetical protein